MQSDPAVVEAEGERAGSPFPATVAARTLAARARRSGGAPPPSAADHKGCDLSLNPRPRAGRDPAPPSQNRGKKAASFYRNHTRLFGSACQAKQVQRRTLVATASGSVLAPIAVAIKVPRRGCCVVCTRRASLLVRFKLLLLWLLLLGLLSVLASALGLLAERFWICRHCWFSRGRR